MTTIREIARTLKPALGRPNLATKRACTVRNILECVRATATAKRRVRVYSAAGFVPNSYKWPCAIQYVEATRADDGWQYRLGWCGAQRARGAGTRVVVQ